MSASDEAVKPGNATAPRGAPRRPLLSRDIEEALSAPVLALVPVGIAAAVAGLAYTRNAWGLVGVPAINPNFADLRQVTSTSECLILNANWSMESPTCDPFGREYNYPSAWARAFAVLGIREADTEVVGLGLAILFFASLWLVNFMVFSRHRSLMSVILLTVASCSPPVMLLVERGNIDLIVFAVIVLSVWAARRARGMPTAVALAVATVLKVFPAGSALVLLEPTKGRLLRVLTFTVVSAVGVLAWFSEFLLAALRTPQATGTSFGSSVIPSQAWSLMGLPGDTVLPRVVGLAAYFVLLALLLLLMRLRPTGKAAQSIRVTAQGFLSDPRALQLALAGGGTVLFAFLVGSNWDYRLSFAILLLGAVLIAFPNSPMQVSLPSLLVVTMFWGTFAVPSLYETLFEVVLFVLMLGIGAILAVTVVLLMRQPSPGR